VTHPATKHMLELIEQLTGYRVSVDLISEIAMLGREGFDINSPEKKYSLKSLRGHFSGLM